VPDVFRQLIPETRIEGMPLGRHVEHDPRSREFEAETATRIISVKHDATGLPLDQGDKGACTAYATCAALNSSPDFKGRVYTGTDGDHLYSRETAEEGEPWPPNDPGGTGLRVCKAAKELGWISRYTHCFSLNSALRALVLRPVITGISWYSSFDTPDPDTGICSITDSAFVRGGHEICADEIDADKELVWLWQSWGKWGLDGSGRFAFSFATWGRLLSEHGDVTVPMP
jgi:hypothetical protein